MSLKGTTVSVPNLQRDQTYSFYVYAKTTFGNGALSNTTATISRYFGQVQNLRQSFKNYTLKLQWDEPSDVEAKDITVSSAIYYLARNIYIPIVVFVLRTGCLFSLLIAIQQIFFQGKDWFSCISFSVECFSIEGEFGLLYNDLICI